MPNNGRAKLGYALVTFSICELLKLKRKEAAPGKHRKVKTESFFKVGTAICFDSHVYRKKSEGRLRFRKRPS